MSNTGIYKITNTITNNFYIGSSININTRWIQHKSLLSLGIHNNKYLQASYNKHGIEVFKFEILLLCDEAMLLIEEQKLLDLYYNTKTCFNLSRDASSPMKGRKHSEASKKKIGDNSRGKPRPEEVRKKISKSHKGVERPKHVQELLRGMGVMKGDILSEETKKKISEALTGTVCSEETKNKIRLANAGKPKSDEHKAKLKAAWKLRRNRNSGVKSEDDSA